MTTPAQAAAAAPLLRAVGVSVRLGSTEALRAVDLDLHRGELIALVGPNGAGKSTLLAVLAGDQEPDQGSVELAGRSLATYRTRTLAQARAVQTQEARLSFAFSAGEVVQMGRAPWRGTVHEAQDEQIVAYALGLTEMTALAARQFPSLSGGEKARVSFAKVLAQETAVLMLDEPTAALDIRHQESVLAQARERALAGAGVVVVLHDLTLAAAYADRVILLDQGRVQADGTPAEVLTAARLSEVYRYPVSVLHTEHGDLVVLPVRRPAATPELSPVSPRHQEVV